MRQKLLHTVRGRYILIISFLVFGILGVIIFFSIHMIRTTVENRGRSYMESSVHMLASQVDQEYRHILQIAQHMTSEGVVGQQVNDILRAKDMYDLGEAKRVFSKSLQTVTAIGEQVELALYYSPDENDVFASTFLPRKNFSLSDELKTVRRTRHISFHAIHQSQSRISDHDVVSVSWLDTFANEKDLAIYVEVRTSLPNLLKEINENEDSDYTILQLTHSGEICYTSNPGFDTQAQLQEIPLSDETFGFTDQLVWCRQRSDSDFYYVLIKPKNLFYADLVGWTKNLIIAIVISVLFLATAVILFNKMILRKLQKIVDAVNAVRRPELIMTSERTGLLEYDKLMDRFRELLEYAQQLIMEVRLHEEEKSRLELETLYYQINPHFLMNSLNTLYWLARLNNQKEISTYAHHLMELLSYSLGRTSQEPTLRTELEVMKEYLALEQVKHSFSVEYDIAEGNYLDAPTPRLFLQPLVENAVNHGMDTDGKLTIRVGLEETGAIIVIEDDGCGIGPEKIEQLRSMESMAEHGGIGLRYTVSMLRQFYGNEALLTIENLPTHGTRVTVRLGMWKEKGHDSGSAD